jgi:hemerythrin superfamily protein
MTNDQQTDLIAAIQRDHREVEGMLQAVESASGDARRSAFDELATKLKVHEEAEQKGVHPRTAEEGGADEAKALRAEESAASKALKELESLDVDSPDFETGFARLKADVLAHAREEEREEHPRLKSDTSPEELDRRGQMFEDAERSASKS